MKTFFTTLSVLTLLSCSPQQKKEKAITTLTKSQKKLSTYKKSVDMLSANLIKLHRQFEIAEDEIVLQVKEFRLLPNAQELQHIRKAIEKKESVEGRIEETILEINTLADSVLMTERRILEVKGMMND
jgi:hypothetical protein